MTGRSVPAVDFAAIIAAATTRTVTARDALWATLADQKTVLDEARARADRCQAALVDVARTAVVEHGIAGAHVENAAGVSREYLRPRIGGTAGQPASRADYTDAQRAHLETVRASGDDLRHARAEVAAASAAVHETAQRLHVEHAAPLVELAAAVGVTTRTLASRFRDGRA